MNWRTKKPHLFLVQQPKMFEMSFYWPSWEPKLANKNGQLCHFPGLIPKVGQPIGKRKATESTEGVALMTCHATL
jgi:hypothetical protein